MDRLTFAFWFLVAALLGATAFYTVGVARQQNANQTREVKLENGDLVLLAKVIDGDTIVVNKGSEGSVTVRLLGIKALPSKHGKDETAVFGRASEEALKRIIGNRPLRVLLNNPPRDRHGRTLATLYAEDQDIALALVAQGHALVYSVYPFPSMPLYLQEQNQARAKHLGLWGDAEVSSKAEALIREWAKQGG